MIWLSIATGVQLIVVAVLAVVVLSLARQVGILHERLSPAGIGRRQESLRTGDRLPELSATTLDGTSIDFHSTGRVSALLFVAADCPICKSILPAFEDALIADESVSGYWVADGLQMADYPAYASEHRIPAERFVLSQELGLVLDIRQIPALVIVDREGRLQAQEVLNGPKQVGRFFARERHDSAVN